MTQSKIIILIIIFLLFSTWLGWLLLKKPASEQPSPAPLSTSSPTTESTSTPGEWIEEDCDGWEFRINNLISQANFCNLDVDCVVTGSEFLLCPFGCYLLVNKTTNVTPIKQSIEKFGKTCPICLYECPYLPELEDIKCIKNKCVDIRFEETDQTSATGTNKDITNSTDINVNEKCKYYNRSCVGDTDCVSITQQTSCYESCEAYEAGCESVPKCCVVNKNYPLPICESSTPCQEPKQMKCLDKKCVGFY